MFILLEGIDGAGKGHQRTELVTYLNDKVPELHTIDFPDHNSVLYKHLIHPAISEEITLSKSSLFISYALDQLLWQEKIKPAVDSREIYFVADGYFTTNIVYQCIMNKSFTIDEALHFADTFGICPPDLAIYLDVDPEIAMKRKIIEEGHEEGLDIYERSLEKQKQIRQGFKQLVSEKIYCKEWVEIDGNGPLADVTSRIKKIIEEKSVL